VIDIAPLTGAIRPAASPGEIGGVVLAGGEQVELLDPYWLFEQAGAHQPGAANLICAIAAGDPWLENMLRPMVESLGYTVVPAGEGVHADIVIASAEAPAPPATIGAQLLRLRATPDAPPEGSDSIYRYDRVALLAALGQASGGRRHG
jgi:two-component system chemotaxis sensor kinase CheA